MRSTGYAVALTAVLACGRSTADPAGLVSIRDSAGIELVEHAAGSEAKLPAWTIADSPSVDIGGRDSAPGQDLHLVSGVARLSDGRIVVANRGSSEVLVFDSTGNHVLTIGRQGTGPGEFGTLGSLQGLPGDSIFVLDPQLRRASIFGPNGSLVRSAVAWQFPAVTPGANRPYLYATASLFDGRMVGASMAFPEMKETSGPVRRDSFAVILLEPDSSSADTIAILPWSEQYPAIGHEGGHSFPTIRTVEFGRTTMFTTDGTKIYAGTNEPLGIRVFDSSGRLLRIIRSATLPDVVTEEDRASRKREAAASLDRQRASEQVKAEWRLNQESPRFAERFPYYERLMIAEDGSLWAQLPRRSESAPWQFLVYDSSGRAVARVTCPERVRPWVLGPDRIIGVWRDPDDIQHVRVYPGPGKQ